MDKGEISWGWLYALFVCAVLFALYVNYICPPDSFYHIAH